MRDNNMIKNKHYSNWPPYITLNFKNLLAAIDLGPEETFWSNVEH